MSIRQAYRELRKSVVAFIAKYERLPADGSFRPDFPPIVGSGVVVREDGVIATNAHVVAAFARVRTPPDAPTDEWPVRGLIFELTERAMVCIPLDVLGVARMSTFEHGNNYYGPTEGPDIAFVQVKAKGLRAAQIDSTTLIEEGMDVAVAGFPCGRDLLAVPGSLHQVTPTLQRGIISAVLPFACSAPHAFSMDIMTHGGASGSAVVSWESGKLLGLLYGGLTLGGKDRSPVPASISYAVPSHYIVKSMECLAQLPNMKLPNDARGIDELLKEAESLGVRADHRNWGGKEADPDVEGKAKLSLLRPGDAKTH